MARDPRPLERLRHHYEVERELADRLRHSTREQRATLFHTLYDELFTRVPDHPRLTRRETEESVRRAVAARLALLRDQLDGVKTFLEFAPGDCRLAFEVCRSVERVIGVDISDQTSPSASSPPNFKLLVYNGYDLNLPDASADLVFSYQFLEHLHPDDVQPHFQLVHRLLKPGGAYIFSTPHRFSGPHDISSFFSTEPQGLHLKEWTYGEMIRLVKSLGFSGAEPFRFGKPRQGALWTGSTVGLEFLIEKFPRSVQRRISSRLFQSVSMLVRK